MQKERIEMFFCLFNDPRLKAAPRTKKSRTRSRITELKDRFRQYLSEELAVNEDALKGPGAEEMITERFIQKSQTGGNRKTREILQKIGPEKARTILSAVIGDVRETSYLLGGYCIREYRLSGRGRNAETVLYLPTAEDGTPYPDRIRVAVLETPEKDGGATFFTCLVKDGINALVKRVEKDRYDGLRKVLSRISGTLSMALTADFWSYDTENMIFRVE